MADGNLPPEPISPGEFERIMGGLQLGQIALLNSVVNLINRQALMESAGQLDLNLDFQSSFSDPEVDGMQLFAAVQVFTLVFRLKDQPVLIMNCTYQLDYLSQNAITEEFFEVFKNTTLMLQTVPYAREFFQSMTSRMNIPVFTLPVIMVGGASAPAAQTSVE